MTGAPVPMVLAAAIGLGACHIFDDCTSDTIRAAMSATVDIGDLSEGWALSGQVGPGNLDQATYDRLVAVLIDGTQSTAGVVWTLSQGLGNGPGYLAIHLGGAAQPGQIMPTDVTFVGGGWGFSIGPSSVPVSLSFEVDGFVASGSAGTVEVLQTAPLRLRFDVTFSDVAGATVSIAGVMDFTRIVESISCD